MLLGCFCIALIIFLITLIVVYFNRKQFNKSVQIMLIGIIGIITILIFPMYDLNYDWSSSLLFAVLYALRSLSGCQSVDVSHKVLVEGELYYLYYTLLYIAFVIAPIFTTSFLVSIFGDLSDKIRYRFLWGKSIHIFSDLNESSVLLCESMDYSNARFVFCNTKLSSKDKDSELVKKARRLGAVILEKSELDLKVRKYDIKFYQISNNKDYNINSTVAIIKKYRKYRDKTISIATFSTGITTELLLDSIDKGNIKVELFDEIKYSCYSLLDKQPLFEGVTGNKISALIVGCDYTGMEMLKAILWCGQLSDMELEINVFDKDANKKKKSFYLNCPDVAQNKYNINFTQVDVKTDDFETALNQYCKDTNYVVVATGDDKINIDTAVYLRKYFLRRDREHFHNKPKINLRVRDAMKNKQVDALCDRNIRSYELYSFGCVEKTFNIENLLGTGLELMARGVHLSYYNALDIDENKQNELMSTYYAKEYNQRSSFATALHIKYKLYAAGVKGLSGNQITLEQIEQFQNLICNPEVLEKVAILEHRRWVAFMQTEGYSTASVEDVRVYYKKGKSESHVHYLAKLHPTLVEWDELDEVSAGVSEIKGKSYDFKKNDYDMIKNIPTIVKKFGMSNTKG